MTYHYRGKPITLDGDRCPKCGAVAWEPITGPGSVELGKSCIFCGVELFTNLPETGKPSIEQCIRFRAGEALL